MLRAWIISSGTELALGQAADTNAAWLARHAAELGIRPERLVVVPDDAAALRDVLRAATAAADVVLLTGGLGPTADDLTRHVLADLAGVPLETDAACLAALRAFFEERGREMPPSNRIQAMIPRSGRALPNPCGTAPGIAIELGGRPCFALPGVPHEMQTMFAREVAPVLAARAGGRVLVGRALHCFGLPESEVGSRLGELMDRGRNPEIGTTAHLGLISVRINATAESRPAAATLLDQAECQVRARLGQAVFGRDADTLAAVVGEALAAAGRTLATAESCTGGLLGQLITDVPGSSRYYLGGVVTYADSAKKTLLGLSAELLAGHGAVSEPVASAMAAGGRRLLGSDYALAITGVAGPAGGSAEKPVGLVYIALTGPAGGITRELRLGRDAPRRLIRTRAAQAALNLLRLALADGAGGP
jgi:nicotinamide-nucleotide amidase